MSVMFRATTRLLLLAIATVATRPSSAAEAPATPGSLYQSDRIWDIHLRFEPDQWKALEPDAAEGGFPGPGGPGRPPGPGGRPGAGGGPGGFGPGMFLAPGLMGQADANRDGKVTREELREMGGRWFSAWDARGDGRVGEEALREGLNRSLAAGPGAPGGPPAGGGPGADSFLRGREGGRNGLSAARGIVFEYVRAAVEIEGRRFGDVAVRYKGNGTYMTSQRDLKRPLKLDLNEFVKGQKLAGLSKLNLHNNVTDPSGMNESIAYRLYRDAGVPAPRTAYARVRLTVPGEHDGTPIGLYSLVENIDNNFFAERHGSRKGLILKPVTSRPFEYLGDDWSLYQQAYDPKTDITPAQIRRVLDFCRLVSDADDSTFAAEVGGYLDLEEFARYLAVTVWISTLDSILGVGQNYVVYLNPKTDRFEFLPWDLDHSFGQFPMVGSQEERERLSIREPWHREVRLLQRVMAVPAFRERYLALMAEFQGTIFQPSRLIAQVDHLASVLRPAMEAEGAEKLARFDAAVAGESPAPPPGFGGPGRFGPMMSPAKPIKGFVPARHASVAAQLRNPGAGRRIEGGFPGGGPGPGRRMPGPGDFLAGLFLGEMDADKDRHLARPELIGTLDRWFTEWDVRKEGLLGLDDIRDGMNRSLNPFRDGPPPGP